MENRLILSNKAEYKPSNLIPKDIPESIVFYANFTLPLAHLGRFVKTDYWSHPNIFYLMGLEGKSRLYFSNKFPSDLMLRPYFENNFSRKILACVQQKT